MTTRKQYVTAVNVYEKRRNAIRERLDYNPDSSRNAPEGYLEAVSNLNYKIRIWKKAIRRIDVYQVKVRSIDNKLRMFLGSSVRGARGWIDPNMKLSRNIFVKYCMEHQIPGPYISAYLGLGKTNSGGTPKKYAGYVGDIRMRFTRSFATSPSNREMYHRFLKYIDQVEEY
jgi:hypothetical protein